MSLFRRIAKTAADVLLVNT